MLGIGGACGVGEGHDGVVRGARGARAVSRPGRFSVPAADWAIALVVAGLHLLNPRIGPAEPAATPVPVAVLGVALVLAQSLPLVWRRRRPEVVLVVAGAGWVLGSWWVAPSAPFGLWVASYSVIVYGSRRAAGIGAAASIVAVAAVQSVQVYAGPLRLADAVLFLVLTPLVVVVGFVVADRRARGTALRERAAFLERERAALASQAVAEERLRIARELHDSVTHSLTTMAIQSSAARLALPDHLEVARAALEAIETCSREATRELRQLLGVLREDEDTTGRLASGPGLGGVDALVERMRAAGLDLRLSVHGERREVPREVDLVAYRVVQEALTNTLKHAGAVSAAVRIDYTIEWLLVEVTDAGGAGPRVNHPVTGHGLAGMRERVNAVGGEFAAGPRREGGFGVTARLPVAGEGR